MHLTPESRRLVPDVPPPRPRLCEQEAGPQAPAGGTGQEHVQIQAEDAAAGTGVRRGSRHAVPGAGTLCAHSCALVTCAGDSAAEENQRLAGREEKLSLYI